MSKLKGVYELNPTKAVMKQGSKQSREAQRASASNVGNRNTKPATVAADTYSDGRKHEDQHAAVKLAKGKK